MWLEKGKKLFRRLSTRRQGSQDSNVKVLMIRSTSLHEGLPSVHEDAAKETSNARTPRGRPTSFHEDMLARNDGEHLDNVSSPSISQPSSPFGSYSTSQQDLASRIRYVSNTPVSSKPNPEKGYLNATMSPPSSPQSYVGVSLSPLLSPHGRLSSSLGDLSPRCELQERRSSTEEKSNQATRSKPRYFHESLPSRRDLDDILEDENLQPAHQRHRSLQESLPISSRELERNTNVTFVQVRPAPALHGSLSASCGDISFSNGFKVMGLQPASFQDDLSASCGHLSRENRAKILKTRSCSPYEGLLPSSAKPRADKKKVHYADDSVVSMTRSVAVADGDDDMSLKEPRTRGSSVVARSQSFGGLPERAPGPHPPGLTPPVLGDTLKRTPNAYTRPQQVGARGSAASFRKTTKIPKIPRPNRALLIFESVKRGLREFIEATKEDIAQLLMTETTTSAQGKLHEADKQIKVAERYLKKLEFHLSKIDELHDAYTVNLQLREGARNMARAYTSSMGHHRKDSITNVKYGYRECSQTLCAIEAQLENMLGTFQCKLKGMAGFARLCPGDVFEVTIRHGPQKWKTKGRMERNNTQRWDVPEFTFKTLVGEVLAVKAVESRSFKSVVLGQKNCEVKDLFSANPQLMTVSINVNGSLKLSVYITWNPLDGMDETVSFYEPPSKTQGTPRRRPVSVLALNGHLSASQGDLQGPERRYSTPIHLQGRDFMFGSSASLPTRAHDVSPLNLSPHMGNRDSGVSLSTPGSSSQQTLNLPSTSSPQLARLPGTLSQTMLSMREEPSHVEEALNMLMTSLEDFLGQYTELQKLEEVVVALEHFIRKHSRSSSRSSSISVSIESALEAFNFLNTEDAMDDLSTSPQDSRRSSLDQYLASPESTAKTADSGIESLAKRLSEDTQLGSSLGSSPLPPSTGNEQVDSALLFHLVYCDRLLESLGNFGPLKCREFYALDKLQKQAKILESLLKIARTGSEVDLHTVMSELTEDKALREYWTTCVDQNVLYVPADKMAVSLEQKFAARIRENFEVTPTRVVWHIVAKVLDVGSYEAEKMKQSINITLHQFMSYFASNGGFANVDDVATELQLTDRLSSGNPDTVVRAIVGLRDTLPSPMALKVLAMLLVGCNKETAQASGSYLRLVAQNRELRDRAMVVLVEGLEDQLAEVRAGACAALSVLEATESIDQLAFLCQTDGSASVRRKAKEALYNMGEVGRKAFDEAQLTSHGFQGLQVRK